MAYGDFGRTTELEAINLCLGTIGEQPVSAVPTSGVSKASLARDLVYEMSRDLQLEGLQCNTETKYLLELDEDSYATLPSNCLNVDTYWLSDNHKVERAGKLYDTIEQTFVLTEDVYVNMTLFLGWTDLPQHVRRYAGVMAARAFQKRFVASGETHRFTEEDELKAKRQFQRKEMNNTDVSLFDNPYLNRGTRR